MKAREFLSDKPKEDKFFVLPDGQVVSTQILWPNSQPKKAEDPLKNPLTRLPLLVVIFALKELSDQERSECSMAAKEGKVPVPAWTAARIAKELTTWLRDHGASDNWLCRTNRNGQTCAGTEPLTGDNVSNFRAKLDKKQLGSFFPPKKERKKDLQ